MREPVAGLAVGGGDAGAVDLGGGVAGARGRIGRRRRLGLAASEGGDHEQEGENGRERPLGAAATINEVGGFHSRLIFHTRLDSGHAPQRQSAAARGEPVKSVLRYVMAAFYVWTGVSHFTRPEFFLNLMPPYIPLHTEMVYLSGVAEIVLGVLVAIPRTATFGGVGHHPDADRRSCRCTSTCW